MMKPMWMALYLAWGLVWTIVVVFYGRAAYSCWKEQGGRWRDVPLAWGRTVAWPFIRVGADVCNLLRLRRVTPMTKPDMRWSAGHLLRCSIGAGAFTSGLFGFYFIGLDRSQWMPLDVTVNLVGILISLVAALGHLYVAWQANLRRWTWLFVGLVVFVPLFTFTCSIGHMGAHG